MDNQIKLNGISETLLIPLYIRAKESHHPNPLVKDDKAATIAEQLGLDTPPIILSGHDEVALMLRVRQFDRRVQNFLVRHPDGVVVHIGCGLDTRFERVDNGQVEWFDLDLPPVTNLRKNLIKTDEERYHLLSDSVFSEAWIEAIHPYASRPLLFMAEAVLAYFEEVRVKSLVVKLRKLFPGSELVCDAYTPFLIQMNNLQLSMGKMSARMDWGLKQGKDLEMWDDGIKILDAWYYFDQPEPRMEPYRWMRFFPFLAKSTGIFHYKLGLR